MPYSTLSQFEVVTNRMALVSHPVPSHSSTGTPTPGSGDPSQTSRVSCAEIVPDDLRTSTSGKDAGRGYICLETHAIVSYELGTSSAIEGTGIGSQVMVDNQSDAVKLCHLETQIIKVMPDPSMSALIENLLLLYNERLEFLEEALDEVVNGTGP
eukprot:SM000131S26718  [mRNA]  locus=s131:92462:93872:- [translate_table: standard]